jgi:hypothetical protein
MEFLIAIGAVSLIFYGGVRLSRIMQEHELHPKAAHHTRLYYWFCDKWKKLEVYVHSHQKRYHQAHGLLHASYFTMVFTHGPYNLAAAGMLVLIIIGWLLHLEDR